MKFILLFTLCLLSANVVSRNNYLTSLIIPAALYSSQEVEIPYGEPPTQGGLAITFDDFGIPGWYSARHIFNRYGARATFFLSYPNLLQGEENGAMMRALVSDGHELGAHGYTHNYVVSYDSMDTYFDEAIYPHTESVIASGFKRPISFAYPGGSFTEESDIRLLDYYRFVRRYTLSITDGRVFYSPTNSSHSLESAGVHENYPSVETVIKSIERAHVRNEILIIASHRIAVTWEDRVSDYTITHAKLDAILKAAHDRGMKFYTIGGLPNYNIVEVED